MVENNCVGLVDKVSRSRGLPYQRWYRARMTIVIVANLILAPKIIGIISLWEKNYIYFFRDRVASETVFPFKFCDIQPLMW